MSKQISDECPVSIDSIDFSSKISLWERDGASVQTA